MDTMTIIVISVLAIAAGGGIMSSAIQWRSRKDERREHQRWISENARLENEMDELAAKYDNEVKHRQWAIGRIKDQSATIRSLERLLKTASKDRYRQWKERTVKKEDNTDV